MNDRGSGIRVRVRRQSLNDSFLIAPNKLIRGEGVYACLDEFGRLLLLSGLSCVDEFETTMADIESWLPSLGRNRQETVRRQLREHGFLKMSRQRIPKGQPNGGQYVWTFDFHMEQLPVDQRDELPVKKDQAKKTPTMPRNSGHGGEERPGGKTPGGTMPGFSGHGEPGHGEPGPGDGGDVYKEEKDHFLKERNSPLTPDDDATAPDPAGAATGGEEISEEEKTKQLLVAGLEKAMDLKPNWKRWAVRRAMDDAIRMGFEPQAVAIAIAIAAADPDTLVPGRITSDKWWADNMLRAESGEAKPQGPPCPKPHHGAYRADNCGICRADEIGVDNAEKYAASSRAWAIQQAEQQVQGGRQHDSATTPA